MKFPKKLTIIRFLIFLITIFTLSVISNSTFGQSLVINEVMSSNSTIIADHDRDFSDWIEIYNYGTEAVDLLGFGLSDSITIPLKWTFPNITLPPNEYLLVFASAKDKKEVPLHWETVINQGNEWKYFVGTEEPPADWKSLDFNASTWSSGASGFGYGDNDDATVIPTVMSCFVRKEFEINDISEIKEVLLHIDYDDGFVAYLNGVSIAWENIDFQGTPPPYHQATITYTEPLMAYGNPPASYQIQNWETFLKTGTNVLAIQVHNSGLNSSDITLIPFLTLGMNTIPSNANGVPEILNFSFPHMHTNFKIKSSGETITLSNASGVTIDQIATGTLPTDISLGRKADGTGNWFLFQQPTPNASNTTQTYEGVSTEPIFSYNGGFYSNSLSIELSGNGINEIIYYTTDGSEPTESSNKYTTPISITSTSTIRAKTFGTGTLASRIVTNSYFINVPQNLPIVSLTTTHTNLFDWNTGIYEMGPNASADFPHFGANFWEDWEIAVNIELFDQNGFLEMNTGAGVKIFGGYSRANAQKSFAFFARKQYGNSSFDAQLFEGKDIDKFESFTMRNSGNDWQKTMFRDGMMTSLVNKMNIDLQAFRPAILYINGKYWGIQNMREKINEHFLENNYPKIDPNNIELLEANANPIHGDAEHYNNLISIISQNNFDYENIKTLMDIENYIDYQLSQIYFDNTDWPGNNIKFWRPNTPEGKWRWILYDTDFGFGIWDSYRYTFNTLNFALEKNGPGWPNPPWSTFLFRRITTNLEFRNDFINRFADMLNTTFLYKNVSTHIESIENKITSEMPNQISKWGRSMNDWQYHVNVMKNFAIFRPNYMRSHIITEFGLQNGTATVKLDVYPENSGNIKINTIYPEKFTWNGIYFKDVPVTIIAEAPTGYRFTNWSGDVNSDKDTLVINLTAAINLTANFIEDASQVNKIVINEINYNSSVDVDCGDWIELYNTTNNQKDISNWAFKDSDDNHSYIFPKNTILAANDYLVLCRDTAAFKVHFPNITKRIGNFDFGLSNSGELIRLYDETSLLIDSIPYGITEPWAWMPNGNGPTLELIKPWRENSKGKNWLAESNYGTPGKLNYTATSINEIEETILSFKNYPNPFSEQTTIEFYLHNQQYVRLDIYNTSGNLVKTLVNDNLSAGQHAITWNASDKNNNILPAGLYIYKLSTSVEVKTGKAMLVK